MILDGILLNRNDIRDSRAEFNPELRAEIGSVRSELGTMNTRLTKIQDDLIGFHRSLGQHDKAIEILEKKRQ